MFYDERIHAVKGKAFRSTLIFASILFAVLAAIQVLHLRVNHEPFCSMTLLIEAVALTAGAGILIGGEIAWGGRGDEMREARRNSYYARSFYVFIYIFAGIFCVAAPLAPIFSVAEAISPYMLLWQAVLPCWLFLLWQFKRNEVPLNSSFLEEPRGLYWKRVWLNVLKFGGICLGFTLAGLCVLMLALMATTSSPVLSAVYLTLVLRAGLAAWNLYSLLYLMFSLAERSSDRAKLAGRISGCTRTFLWLGLAFALAGQIISAVQVYIARAVDFRNSVVPMGTVISNLSYLSSPLAELGYYFITLFLLYLFSELRPLRDRALGRLLSACFLISLIGEVFSIVQRSLIQTAVWADAFLLFENANEAVSAISTTFSTVSLTLGVAGIVCRVLAAARLSRHRVLKTGETITLSILWAASILLNLLQSGIRSAAGLIVFLTALVTFPVVRGVLDALAIRRIDRRPMLTTAEEAAEDEQTGE